MLKPQSTWQEVLESTVLIRAPLKAEVGCTGHWLPGDGVTLAGEVALCG